MIKYLISGLIIISLLLLNQCRLTEKYRDKSVRWEENYDNLKDSSSVSYMTYEEYKKRMSEKVEDLMDSLNVKSKSLSSITETKLKVVYVKEAKAETMDIEIRKNVITKEKERILPFVHSPPCFNLEGYMTLTDSLPNLTFTKVEHVNNITDVVYMQRSKKFLFIKYGKWRARRVVVPECGEVKSERIDIVKE